MLPRSVTRIGNKWTVARRRRGLEQREKASLQALVIGGHNSFKFCRVYCCEAYARVGLHSVRFLPARPFF